MDATGPVTVVSKTQVATGDRGSYDKDQNKVWLFGNVTLSDGGNVTKGDKLTYDLTSGEAVVEVGKELQSRSRHIHSRLEQLRRRRGLTDAAAQKKTRRSKAKPAKKKDSG